MGAMGTSNLMQIILIGILLLCGYMYLLNYVYNNTANKNAFPVLALIGLVIYGTISGFLIVILMRLGDWQMIFMGILMLFSCLSAFILLSGLFKHFHELNKGMLAMFVVYLMAVAYITIYSREEGAKTAIFTGFTSIEQAIARRSLLPLRHMGLNLLLFVPIGFLFPMINRERLDKFLYVAPMGAMMSVTIESVQLLMRMGHCDLEDLTANTLGAIAGLFAYRIYVRLFERT